MFPMAAALMHAALERAADRFGDRDAVRVAMSAGRSAELDDLSNAFARHLTARGSGPVIAWP
jgi:thiazole synthase ThiGH ThiG subunit